MLSRLHEFVEDGGGKLSTPPAMAILVVFALCFVIINDSYYNQRNDIAVEALVTLISILYGLKKGFDSAEVRAQIKADSAPIVSKNVTNIGKAETVQGS